MNLRFNIIYLKGNNIVHSIACSRKWELWNKLYFCFILSLPSVILFFLYQSDIKLTLDFSIIVYYSLIIFVFTTIVACLLYVLFELPYKRVSKFWVNAKETTVVQSQMIEMNSNPIYQGDFNIYDDNDEDEDEEEDNADKPILNNIL